MTRLSKFAPMLCLVLCSNLANAQYGRGRGNVVTPWGTMTQSQYQMMIYNPEAFQMMLLQREEAALLKQYRELSREQQAIYKNYQEYQKMMRLQNAQNGGGNSTFHPPSPSGRSKSHVKKKPTPLKKTASSPAVSAASNQTARPTAASDPKNLNPSAADKLKVFDVKSASAPKAETVKPKISAKPNPSAAVSTKPEPKPRKKISKPAFDFVADDEAEKKP